MADIVLVSNADDPHADLLADALTNRDIAVFRLNTDEPGQIGVSWNDLELSLTEGFGLKATTQSLGFIRKPISSDLSREWRTPEEHFEMLEHRSLVEALLVDSSRHWIAPHHLLVAASQKLPQLAAARRAELPVPRSLVSTSATEIRAFISYLDGEAIIKPLQTGWFVDQAVRYDLFANAVEGLQLIEGTDAVAPTLVQERIPKSFEVRCQIVGDSVFAVRLETATLHRADWRRYPVGEIEHRLMTLPSPVETKLRRFVAATGVPHASIDLVATRRGEFYFLENNPTGAWFWLQQRTGAPIAEAFVELLSGACR